MEVIEMSECTLEFLQAAERKGCYIQQYKANGEDMLYIIYPILKTRGAGG